MSSRIELGANSEMRLRWVDPLTGEGLFYADRVRRIVLGPFSFEEGCPGEDNRLGFEDTFCAELDVSRLSIVRSFYAGLH